MRCPHEDCCHIWKCRSKYKFISCPSCMRKVKNTDRIDNMTDAEKNSEKKSFAAKMLFGGAG